MEKKEPNGEEVEPIEEDETADHDVPEDEVELHEAMEADRAGLIDDGSSN